MAGVLPRSYVVKDTFAPIPAAPFDWDARRTQIVSRWLTLAGLACALVLAIGIGITPWVELLFPLWILALSLDILAAG